MVRINTKHLQELNSYLQQVSATVKLLDITDQSANEKKTYLSTCYYYCYYYYYCCHFDIRAILQVALERGMPCFNNYAVKPLN